MIRIAIRGFRRNPTFTVSAILILGLGMGMAVAMWTIFNAELAPPPAIRDPDRIVLPHALDQAGVDISVDVDRIRRESHTMSVVAGYAHWGAAPWPMNDGDKPLPLLAAQVSGQFFDVLGVKPLLGRMLGPSDDSASHVIVLSYDAWQRYFGGDPAVIGRHFREPMLNWTYSVIGVAPPGVDFPIGTDYWIPTPWEESQDVIARLAPRATPAMARDEFRTINDETVRDLHIPVTLAGASVVPFETAVVGSVRPVLAVMTAAVGLLLLIVCINVGNLMLLRAAARSRELAVRRALGATYGDLVRQLVGESVLLAAAGGGLGLGIAELARRAIIAAAPPQLPRLDAIRVSGTPVGAAVTVALCSVVLFGVLPALLSALRSPATPLRLDARSGAASRERRRVRQALVVSQVALAVILLAGAGLLSRSLARLQSLDLGYRAEHLAVLAVTFPIDRYPDQPTLRPLFDKIAPRLQAVPGVVSLSPTVVFPMIGANIFTSSWQVDGESADDASRQPFIPWDAIGPEYFRTLGIPIVRGRGVIESDRTESEPVAIVSASVARRYWPGQDPIGKRIRMPDTSEKWRTVVGVVGDTHWRTLREATPMVYLPYRQAMWQGYIAIRTRGTVQSIVPAIQRALDEVDPDLVVWEARTMDDYLAKPLSQPRLSALLLSTFGLVALTLAAIGLFGLMASTVREQTRDIGVRMALGASPARVRAEVLRRAMAVSLIGAAVGLLGAIAASRLVASLLFEVSPMDPIALSSACAVLLGVAALAAYLPAYHASRVDPSRALRAD